MLTNQQKRTLSNCVQRGARLLDRVRPKWFKRVRAAARKQQLHIFDGYACVLGHVYRDAAKREGERTGRFWLNGYDVGTARLGLEEGGLDARHGFNVLPSVFCNADGIPNPAREREAASYIEEAWARAAERRAA